MELEYAFLRVPFERLSQSFRLVQKLVTKEMGSVLKELDNCHSDEEYDVLITKLRDLKAIVQQRMEIEQKDILSQFHQRLEYLHIHGSNPVIKANANLQETPFLKSQVNRLICSHLLSEGYIDVAESFATEVKINPVFCDFYIYKEAHHIIQALRENHDCQPALLWCTHHASRLRRLEDPNRPTLEFHLRVSEFIEFIRQKKPLEALQYATTHKLAEMTHNGIFESVMTLLALESPGTCGIPKYEAYFSAARYDDLVEQFKSVFASTYGCTIPSLLTITLQAGLCILRTHSCSMDERQENRSIGQLKCPTCTKEGIELSRNLPMSLRTQSQLVCGLTGEPMDEYNLPMALPNGHVYGTNGLLQPSRTTRGQKRSKTEETWVTCIRTGERFQVDQLKPVYIQ